MRLITIRRQVLRRVASGILLGMAVVAGQGAFAQTVTAVPTLDLNRFMGVWYEVARLPIKAEKLCVSDGRVLYALGDKARTFQMGTFCEQKNGTPGNWGANGKIGKSSDGKLKLNRFVLFHTKYWVLETAPDYSWALVGTPNHKSLWVLSRTPTLPADIVAQVESRASASGFKTGKLVTISQHPTFSVKATSTTAPLAPQLP